MHRRQDPENMVLSQLPRHSFGRSSDPVQLDFLQGSNMVHSTIEQERLKKGRRRITQPAVSKKSRSQGVQNWKLSPSDFAFLWEECQRCFYLKVVRQFYRPWSPMPKIFTKIDGIMKRYYTGKNTANITPALPPGVVEYSEHWVESMPITLPGYTSRCFIRGKFDTVVKFHDGTYGVIDFKTSESNSNYVPLYSRQLHAYAYALENAAPGNLHLSPITRLGLLCVEPTQMFNLGELGEGAYAYKTNLTWVECPRDDEVFMAFLANILDVLDHPEPPRSSSDCSWCRYRDAVHQIPH